MSPAIQLRLRFAVSPARRRERRGGGLGGLTPARRSVAWHRTPGCPHVRSMHATHATHLAPVATSSRAGRAAGRQSQHASPGARRAGGRRRLTSEPERMGASAGAARDAAARRVWPPLATRRVACGTGGGTVGRGPVGAARARLRGAGATPSSTRARDGQGLGLALSPRARARRARQHCMHCVHWPLARFGEFARCTRCTLACMLACMHARVRRVRAAHEKRAERSECLRLEERGPLLATARSGCVRHGRPGAGIRRMAYARRFAARAQPHGAWPRAAAWCMAHGRRMAAACSGSVRLRLGSMLRPQPSGPSGLRRAPSAQAVQTAPPLDGQMSLTSVSLTLHALQWQRRGDSPRTHCELRGRGPDERPEGTERRPSRRG